VLVDLAAAMLDRPTVMVVEDHEWIDPASRELIAHMIERPGAHRWVWIITGREAGEWRGSHRIELGPIDQASIGLLITLVAPGTPPRLAATLAERAAGNPLFAVELAGLGRAEAIPDTIERLIATRIDQLGARERRLLRYASVLGIEFDLDLLAEALAPVAAGFDDSGTWSALAEFMSVSPLGKVRFNQGLVRDVAYAGLSFRRRREIHGMVAETIERRARHRARRFAAVLSVHFEVAENHAKTWEYAVTAAERASAAWATHEAVVLYRRALGAAAHLAPTVDSQAVLDVALALAAAADLTGEFDVAHQALAMAGSLHVEERATEVAVASARLHEKRGELDSAAEVLADPANVPVTGPIDHAGLEAVMMLAGIRHRQGRFIESADHCRSVVAAPAIEEHPAVLAHALNLLSLNQTHLGEPSRRENAERALSILESLGDWASTGRVLNNLAIDSYFGGHWDEAAELYRRGREASDRAGDVVMVATFDNNLAEILSDQGRFDEADTLFRRARSIWSASGYPVGEALVASNLGRLAVRRGNIPEGQEMLTRALDRFSEMGASALAFETETRLVEALLCAGDTATSREWLDRMMSQSPDQKPTLERLRAHVLALDGDWDAPSTFEEAAALLDDSGQTYERALALAALALLRSTPSEEATEILNGLGAQNAFVLPVNQQIPDPRS
jgi:tetratricopeptide (TPR) repeat protein